MDQFISTMGLKGSALLIDCRSLEAKLYPLSDSRNVILAVNSNVKHELEGSEYAVRRETCEQVAALLGKSTLRDVHLEELESWNLCYLKVNWRLFVSGVDFLGNRSRMNEVSYKRARHVVTENERTLRATKALTADDMSLFGRLMNQSHDSLR
jgi:galactokinase